MEKKSTKKTTVAAPVREDLGKCLEENEFSEYQRQGFLISEDGVLKGYFGRDAEVTVPDVVTEIGDNVFQGKRLTSLVLPRSVQKIGKSIFRDCCNAIWDRDACQATAVCESIFTNAKCARGIHGEVRQFVASIKSSAV